MTAIGKDVPRKEALDKVTGAVKYNDDINEPGLLHVKMATSTCAHGIIKSIDVLSAWNVPGVRAVVTGDYLPVMTGSVIKDRPPIAINKVRYYGEPVAIVVADTEHEAQKAANSIKIEYSPLPMVKSPKEALVKGAPLVHEKLGEYKKAIDDVYPAAGTNVADHSKIRKGDMDKGWSECDVIVEGEYTMPKSDHIAMETRNVRVKIDPDGKVYVSSSTQCPHGIKDTLATVFSLNEGDIIVNAPLVGGAFGGKAPVNLEFIAYIASRAVGGRQVKLANTREEDIATSPTKIGLEAKVKLGATRDGILKALELKYFVDAGAYSDTAPRMAKTMASNGTGPYNVENVFCDALCLYTNNPYSTSFRGFGNMGHTFCMERTLDKLAVALNMSPFDLRLKNAISPGKGHTSATQVKITKSNTGDLAKCIYKINELIKLDDDLRVEVAKDKVIARGMSCIWKTSASNTDAISGAIIVFNKDGSLNLIVGVMEIGSGVKTGLAQILADKMNMEVDQIHVQMPVNTESSPKHWKTVASMSTVMAGRAVLSAADDAIRQIKDLGSIVLRVDPSQLEIGGGKVYMRSDPDNYVEFKDMVHGFKFRGGNSIGGQIIGKGTYIMENLTILDRETGKGRMGPAWTVGVQAVEVEYNTKDHTYKLVKAATVMDIGKIVNPKTAKGVVMGGMSMGLGLGSREGFLYGSNGGILNDSLRTYKVMRFGEQPDYMVEFIETPAEDGPYGARGLGEHGILGMPAALANALTRATGVELDQVPIDAELIWQLKTGGYV
ncbi:MAG: xanthine dehydrogenase family protein molybdopterin-binding subunit [Clostridiales bacterium]|nr:xanthine dehydrogenase family protein molybdopterin-binding subunit [Clostridiales bacterium]